MLNSFNLNCSLTSKSGHFLSNDCFWAFCSIKAPCKQLRTEIKFSTYSTYYDLFETVRKMKHFFPVSSCYGAKFVNSRLHTYFPSIKIDTIVNNRKNGQNYDILRDL